MVYCAYTDINALSNLTTNDIANADITAIIPYATAKLNGDICTTVVRERVGYIDETRKNSKDSTNTTFYVKNWHGKFIADNDDDGDVDTSDVTVYQVASDGTETTLTVSSITHNLGKIVLETAPSSGVRLYISYRWCWEDCATPSALVKSACVNLSIALCYEKINAGKSPKVVFGNARFERHMAAYNVFYRKYQEDVNRINRRIADYEESNEVV